MSQSFRIPFRAIFTIVFREDSPERIGSFQYQTAEQAVNGGGLFYLKLFLYASFGNIREAILPRIEFNNNNSENNNDSENTNTIESQKNDEPWKEGITFDLMDFNWKDNYRIEYPEPSVSKLIYTIEGACKITVPNITGDLIDKITNILEIEAQATEREVQENFNWNLNFHFFFTNPFGKANLNIRKKLLLARELPLPGLPQSMIQQFIGMPSQTVEKIREIQREEPYHEFLSAKGLTKFNNPNVATRTREAEKTHRKRVVNRMYQSNPGALFQSNITEANIRKYDPRWYQFWKKKPLKRVSNNVKTENWGATQPPQKPWYTFWRGRTRKAVRRRARKTRRHS